MRDSEAMRMIGAGAQIVYAEKGATGIDEQRRLASGNMVSGWQHR